MKKAICAIVLCMCMSFSAAASTTTEENTTTLPDVTTENTLDAMATTVGSTTLPPSENTTTAPTATEGQDDVTTTDGSTTAPTTVKDGEVTTGSSATVPSTTVKDGGVTATGSTAQSRTTVKNGRVTVKGSTTVHTTRPTVPLQTLYADGGVTLQAATGVFPQNAQITVQPLAEGHAAHTALSSLAEQFTAYTVTVSSDDVTVHPHGTFTVTVAIPEGYTPRDTAVVLVGADGTPQILVSKVDAAARTVTAEMDTVGTFAVAQLQTNVKNTPWLTVLTVLGVAAAAVVGYFYFRKQKM